MIYENIKTIKNDFLRQIEKEFQIESIEKINFINELSLSIDLQLRKIQKYYIYWEKFDEEQKQVLSYASTSLNFYDGYVINFLANNALSASKMKLLVEAAKCGCSTSSYTDPKYSLEQLEQIIDAQKQGIEDITSMLNEKLNVDQLNIIKKGLLYKINVSLYENENIPFDAMKIIYKKLLSDKIKFIYDEATGIIKGLKDFSMLVDGVLVIPEQINGVKFTSIEDGAFEKNNLSKVTIPDSIWRVGDSAFANNNLTEVNISDSVRNIGDYAFANNNLSRINIPDSVFYVGKYAFSNNNISEMKIPSSVTHIRDHVFENNKIKAVKIPYSVTHIGEAAFYNNELKKITIPNSVKEIKLAAFADNNLTEINIYSLTEFDASVFKNNPINEGSYNIIH